MKKIIALLAALVVAACSAPDSGRVADGVYHPANSYWVSGTGPVCSGSGINYRCSPGTPGHMQFDAEYWALRLINGDDDGWKTVDETTFHRCNIDEHYPECTDPNNGDVR